MPPCLIEKLRTLHNTGIGEGVVDGEFKRAGSVASTYYNSQQGSGTVIARHIFSWIPLSLHQDPHSKTYNSNILICHLYISKQITSTFD